MADGGKQSKSQGDGTETVTMDWADSLGHKIHIDLKREIKGTLTESDITITTTDGNKAPKIDKMTAVIDGTKILLDNHEDQSGTVQCLTDAVAALIKNKPTNQETADRIFNLLEARDLVSEARKGDGAITHQEAAPICQSFQKLKAPLVKDAGPVKDSTPFRQ